MQICGALRNLVPFVQFKKVKNTHRGAEACNITKRNTPPWVFFTFFNLCKWYQISLSITFKTERHQNAYKAHYSAVVVGIFEHHIDWLLNLIVDHDVMFITKFAFICDFLLFSLPKWPIKLFISLIFSFYALI